MCSLAYFKMVFTNNSMCPSSSLVCYIVRNGPQNIELIATWSPESNHYFNFPGFLSCGEFAISFLPELIKVLGPIYLPWSAFILWDWFEVGAEPYQNLTSAHYKPKFCFDKPFKIQSLSVQWCHCQQKERKNMPGNYYLFISPWWQFNQVKHINWSSLWVQPVLLWCSSLEEEHS